jgi:hypothetical protein
MRRLSLAKATERARADGAFEQSGEPQVPDILRQIENLVELLHEGFIAPDEFEAAKARIFARL